MLGDEGFGLVLPHGTTSTLHLTFCTYCVTDSCQLSNPPSVLLRQTVLGRRVAGRVQAVPPSAKQKTMKDAVSPPSSLHLSVSPDCNFLPISLYHFTYYSRTNLKGQKHEQYTTNSLESDNFQDQSQCEAFTRHFSFHPNCSHTTVLSISGPYLSSSLLVCDVIMFVSISCVRGPTLDNATEWINTDRSRRRRKADRFHPRNWSRTLCFNCWTDSHTHKKNLFSAKHCLSERMWPQVIFFVINVRDAFEVSSTRSAS